MIYVPNIHPQYIRRGEDIASITSGERWFRSNIKNSYTEINWFIDLDKLYNLPQISKKINSLELKTLVLDITITKSMYPLSIFCLILSFPCFLQTNESSLVDYAPKFWIFFASNWIFGLYNQHSEVSVGRPVSSYTCR